MRKLQIITPTVTREAVLLENPTAEAIWKALPIQGSVNRWGDEIYFSIPVNVPLEPSARAEVQVGDLAYWPPGKAFCIFWGPTPASDENEPRAASPVNVFGRITGDPKAFSSVRDGARITIKATPEQ